MMKNKKIVIQTVLCIMSVVLIWSGYIFTLRWMKAVPDDFSWVYQVDSIRVNETKVILDGFAFRLEGDTSKDDYKIVLQNLETGKRFFSKMKYNSRKDVSEFFGEDFVCLESGFEAKFEASKLDLLANEYEVLLFVENDSKRYKTGIYISKGELFFTNPKEYVPLEVAGTKLEEIIDRGVLRVYEPDNHIYVYQYEDQLYWIAEKEYEFVNDNTYIQYQIDSTRPSLLLKERSSNGFFGYSFWFSEGEIENLNTDKYRVARCPIEISVPTTKILTGNCTDKWLWKVIFRPWYNCK